MVNNGPVTHRFVCVLNKRIEIGRALNALGHMAAGLTAIVENNSDLRFQTYIDGSGTEHKSISDNPFIVLRAKNSNKIRKLRGELIEKEISFTDYTHTMVEGGYIDQHKQTQETKEEDIEYFGICFFAKEDVARKLTRSFSLYRV